MMGEISKKGVTPVETPAMSGDLSNFELADVLQMLAGKPGRQLVEIFFSGGVGKIYLEGDYLHRAEIVGPEPREGIEALRELLSLPEGHFEVRQPALWPKHANLQGPVQALILEAARLQDEASSSEESGFEIHEDLFEKDFLPPLKSSPTPQQKPPSSPSSIEKVAKLLPEIESWAVTDPSGELQESKGPGVPEELAGAISFISLQLHELGHLLGLGELRAFAASGKRKMCAALCKGDKFLAMKGRPRKGLLWWSKKLLEAEKEWKT